MKLDLPPFSPSPPSPYPPSSILLLLFSLLPYPPLHSLAYLFHSLFQLPTFFSPNTLSPSLLSIVSTHICPLSPPPTSFTHPYFSSSLPLHPPHPSHSFTASSHPQFPCFSRFVLPSLATPVFVSSHPSLSPPPASSFNFCPSKQISTHLLSLCSHIHRLSASPPSLAGYFDSSLLPPTPHLPSDLPTTVH